ncbi:MAG: hypothetical protein AB7R40_26380 [Nitrospiraceae bacterium]
MRFVILVAALLIFNSAYSGTICVGSCPGESPPTGLPDFLQDVYFEGAGFVQLTFSGNLYIDTSVYNANLEQFTQFEADGVLRFDPIPTDYPFPAYSEITTLALTGLTFLDAGIPADAVIQNLDFAGEIRFHALGDILVTNTSALLAAPLPPTLGLLVGCLGVLLTRKKEKSNITMESDA